MVRFICTDHRQGGGWIASLAVGSLYPIRMDVFWSCGFWIIDSLNVVVGEPFCMLGKGWRILCVGVVIVDVGRQFLQTGILHIRQGWRGVSCL